jgi:hypothetical protein
LSYRMLLAITALVALIFGLGLIIEPARLFALYNLEINTGGVFASQMAGAAVLSVAALDWLGREVADPTGRQTIAVANLVGSAAGFWVSLLGRLSGAAGSSQLGWSTLLVFMLISSSFAYLLFVSKELYTNSHTAGPEW